MKKFLSITLILSMILTMTMVVFATDNSKTITDSRTIVANEKVMQMKESGAPSVSVDMVNEIIGNTKNFYTESNEADEKANEELYDKLSALYLTVEKTENQYKENPTQDLSDKIIAMKNDIERIEKEIVKNGTIILTSKQAYEMFNAQNQEVSPDGNTPYLPPDTSNTMYLMDGTYSYNSYYGLVYYYYIYALPKSLNSNMYRRVLIDMAVDRVGAFKDALAEIYAGKVAGELVSAIPGPWGKIISWMPWELLQSPPSNHYDLTSEYNIIAEYSTNVKFGWCYYTYSWYTDYTLGVIMNRTIVNEEHKNYYYASPGNLRGSTQYKSYDLYDNYFNTQTVMQNFLNGNESVHYEAVDGLRYYYKGSLKKTINPPSAQGYWSMN